MSNPIIYTFLITMSKWTDDQHRIDLYWVCLGFVLLINSMYAPSIHNSDLSLDKIFDDEFDESSSPFKKRSLSNSDIPEGYVGIMLGKRRLESRGIRLPTEAILLGKRRLPYEAVLLGKRDLPNEAILLGKRDLPNEAVLLGKRDLPNEGVLLGKRR